LSRNHPLYHPATGWPCALLARPDMKQLAMTRRKQSTASVLPVSQRKGGGEVPSLAAFNDWLQRGLHQLFDAVVREPIPEEVLRLIEEDRKK